MCAWRKQKIDEKKNAISNERTRKNESREWEKVVLLKVYSPMRPH